jgi:phage baseplate assembly protein W
MKALDFPFRLGPNGHFAPTRSYEFVVRAQIIDALMTNQGERVFRAMYGCDIQAALFDPSDELVRRDMATMLKARLQQFVPRAIIRDIRISVPDAMPVVVFVDVVYRPTLFSADTTVTVPVVSEFVNRQVEILS